MKRWATIRASEIGTFLFCHRAWWYHRRGVPSENTADLADGKEFHYRHGRILMFTGCLRALAVLLVLSSLALLAIYYTGKLF